MSWQTALFLLGAFVVSLTIVPDFVARVARYRRYRRMYPSADRGRVWRHVR